RCISLLGYSKVESGVGIWALCWDRTGRRRAGATRARNRPAIAERAGSERFHPSVVEDGAAVADDPQAAGIAAPDAGQPLGRAADPRRPGDAVPVNDLARITDGPHVVGRRPPDPAQVLELRARRHGQRPGQAVPVQDDRLVADGPDVV